MKKTYMLYLIIAIIICVIFWPKDVVKLNSDDIEFTTPVSLRIIHRNSIEEAGTLVETKDIKEVKELLTYLKPYKSVPIPVSFKNFDKEKSYYIRIDSNSDEILNISVLGNGYIRIEKNRGFKHYKIINGPLDLDFLKEYFDSLKSV